MKKILLSILVLVLFITLTLAGIQWKVREYRSTRVSAIYAHEPLGVQNILSLDMIDTLWNGTLSNRESKKIKLAVRFFDYFNCHNYEEIESIVHDSESFVYTVTTFNYEFIGLDRVFEYFAIGNAEITAGGNILHLVPRVPQQGAIEGNSTVLTIPFTALLYVGSGKTTSMLRSGDETYARFTFDSDITKIKSVHFEIPEIDNQALADHNRKQSKEGTIKTMCGIRHDRLFATKFRLVASTFDKANKACPDYARSDKTYTKGLFDNLLCEGYTNPFSDEKILGENYEQCIDQLNGIPLMVDNDYPNSTNANTLACRYLHFFGAMLNPNHHCIHLGVPSASLGKNGSFIEGPCTDNGR